MLLLVIVLVDSSIGNGVVSVHSAAICYMLLLLFLVVLLVIMLVIMIVLLLLVPGVGDAVVCKYNILCRT